VRTALTSYSTSTALKTRLARNYTVLCPLLVIQLKNPLKSNDFTGFVLKKR